MKIKGKSLPQDGRMISKVFNVTSFALLIYFIAYGLSIQPAFSFGVSPEDEVQIGQEVWKRSIKMGLFSPLRGKIDKQSKISEIGDEIVNVLPQSKKILRQYGGWKFVVVDAGKKPNAWACPGGFVALDHRWTELQRDEIALILGHEIAHIALGHYFSIDGLSKSMNESKWTSNWLAKNIIVPRVLDGFSREVERAADEWGLLLISRAGFDGERALKFWERMANNESMLEATRFAQFFMRHPVWAERVKDLTETQKRLRPNPELISSLRLLEKPPYCVDQKLSCRFTIENKGTAPITLPKLCAGGRGPGGNEDVQDFTHRSVNLKPRQLYNYQGELVLASPGRYHFFVAYQTPDGNWNTSVPAEEGVRRTLDIVVKDAPDGLQRTQKAAPTHFSADKPDFSDGTLLRGKGTNEVYVVRNGKKCYIPDPETFKAKGYDWSKVTEVDKTTLDKIQTGIPIVSVKHFEGHADKKATSGSFSYWDSDKKASPTETYPQQVQPSLSPQTTNPAPSSIQKRMSTSGLSSLEQQYLRMQQRHLRKLNEMDLEMKKDSYNQWRQWENQYPNLKSDPQWQKAMGMYQESIKMQEENVRMQKRMGW